MTPFWLPVQYWPARSAQYWWDTFSLAEVRRDLELARGHGFTHWVVDLLWSDFAPAADRAAVATLRSLEAVLQSAADAGVLTTIALFPVYMDRYVWLPDFLSLPLETSNYPVMSGHHKHRRGARNLFTDPVALKAEVKLTREVVGAFDQHPAVQAWILGDRLTAASTPPHPEMFGRWFQELSAVIRDVGGRKPVLHGVGAADVILSTGFDPRVLIEEGVTLAVSGAWRPSWAHEDTSVWAGFITAYSRSISHNAPIFAGLAETPSMLERVVRAVQEEGGGGYRAAALFNYSADLKRSPPFDATPEALNRGLMTADGAMTSAGMLWHDLTGSSLTVRDVPEDLPRVDIEARARMPEDVAREWYEVWLSRR